MNIENMIAFVRVAELKKISAAAKELHHLQSNMTNKIKIVEKEVGVPLFYRLPHGVELTVQGEIVYRQFKKIIALWEETLERVNESQQTLVIGVMRSSFPLQLNSLIKEFYMRFPHIKISILTDTTEKLLDKITKHQVDLAFITESKTRQLNFDKHQLVIEELSQDQLVFVGQNIQQPIFKLLNERSFFVFSKSCSSYFTLMELAMAERVGEVSVSEINLVDSLLEIIENNLGIGVLSEGLVKKYQLSSYKLLPKGFRELSKTIVYHKEHSLSSAERWLIAKAREITNFS
jgi:Transcriptional regulator